MNASLVWKVQWLIAAVSVLLFSGCGHVTEVGHKKVGYVKFQVPQVPYEHWHIDGHAESSTGETINVPAVKQGQSPYSFRVPWCSRYDVTRDPLLLQVPSDWYDFSATYSGTGGSGSLVVEEGDFASDEAGHLYVPESGCKLVLVGAPPGTPNGTYTVEASWGYGQTGTRTVKGIVVDHIKIQNTVTQEVTEWFPPSLPQVTDFSQVTVWPFAREITLRPPPVGGLAELPGGPEAPIPPQHRGLVLAVIAAGAIILLGAGWYVRKRRVV